MGLSLFFFIFLHEVLNNFISNYFTELSFSNEIIFVMVCMELFDFILCPYTLYIWLTLTNLLRIHSRLQKFGIKVCCCIATFLVALSFF